MEEIASCFRTTALTINNCEEDILEGLYAKLINSKFGPTYLIYTKKENVYWASTYIKKILDNIQHKLIIGEFDGKTYYYNNNKNIMTLKKHGFIYSNGHYLTEFKLITDINKRENNIVNNNIVKNNIGEVVKPVDSNKLNSLK